MAAALFNLFFSFWACLQSPSTSLTSLVKVLSSALEKARETLSSLSFFARTCSAASAQLALALLELAEELRVLLLPNPTANVVTAGSEACATATLSFFDFSAAFLAAASALLFLPSFATAGRSQSFVLLSPCFFRTSFTRWLSSSVIFSLISPVVRD